MSKLQIKRTFEKVMESKGKMAVSKAMVSIDPPYPDTTAHNPQQITRSKTWEQLAEEYLPDSLLAKRHKELLNKREVIKVFNHTTGEYDKELIDQPETQAVSKGLEMAYKIKKRFSDMPVNNFTFNSYADISTQDLEATRERLRANRRGIDNKGTGKEETK